jgi:hypothetical protein
MDLGRVQGSLTRPVLGILRLQISTDFVYTPLVTLARKSVCSMMSLSEIGRLIVNDCDGAEWIFGEQKVILEGEAEILVSKVIVHDERFWLRVIRSLDLVHL